MSNDAEHEQKDGSQLDQGSGPEHSSKKNQQISQLDQGLGAWIRRNIPDPRVRLLLLVVLALLLLSDFVTRLSAPGLVIEALCVLLLCPQQ